MYKTLLKYLSATVCAMTLCCCSKTAPEALEGSVGAQFSVSIDDPQIYVSKATGDGSKVNKCIMELFYEGESMGQYTADVTSGKATFNVTLVARRTYSAAFWAQKDGSYGTSSLRNVTYGDTYDLADDSMDAFCARNIDFTVSQESAVIPVTLTRPFAMVSISITGGSLTGAVFNAPKSYNVLEDTLGSSQQFSYTHPDFFIFVPAAKSYMDLTVNGKNVQNVPVCRNYKTTITMNN